MKNKKNAFSLIEILIVISVVILISVLAFVFYNKIEKAYVENKLSKDINYSVAEYKNYMNTYNLSAFIDEGGEAYAQMTPALDSSFDLISEKSSRYASTKEFKAIKGFYVNLMGVIMPDAMTSYSDGLYFEYTLSYMPNFDQSSSEAKPIDDDLCASLVLNNIANVKFIDVIGGDNGRQIFSKTGEFEHRVASTKINVKDVVKYCTNARGIKFKVYASD